MKVLSICKIKKKHNKSKKKWKKHKSVNKLSKKLASNYAVDKIHLIFSKMSGNCFWNNYFNAFQWRNNYLNFWNTSASQLSALTSSSFLKNQPSNRWKISNNDGFCSNSVQDCIRNLNDIKLDSNVETASDMSLDAHPVNYDTENSDEIEVSEEMIKFFEINMRNKEQLKAEKERFKKLRSENLNRLNDEEYCSPRESTMDSIRSKEMNQLYGNNAPMIHGMETAIQLTFNWNCDHHKPNYWPILPFRFKFA